MTCGATTRKGTPCKMTALYTSGRCKLHGGMSTGAKTPEGKARQLEGFCRWLETKRQTTSTGDGSH
ncbi:MULTISPECIES: HGGxSTG domain-containing protein [Klebsiella/Raoultella group]|uniref:HGGxSTG domain-containing protein n=1 Tax=Klebsiella/Raoultella group TaxID=2890311 RepID=UPI0027D3426D|nr:MULTISPECIES: HGGxSTG domain-containing protein [Klebsiella/Raoultella group]